MNFRINVSKNFQKEAKPLLKKYPSFKSDLTSFIKVLKSNPELGIALGNNLFKVRVAVSGKGRGKSGGARVITYVVYKDEVVHLISIYDKGEYDTAHVSALLDIMKQEGL